ncbi:MAG: hypothetical protein ACXADO_11600 [Candidatus Thorarchaeota archaeon]|jgi:hypothetical protein
MRESYWWVLGAVVVIFVAAAAILNRAFLPTEPMVIELLATFFGVLIAIALGEAFGANREESRANWVKNELVGELKEILELADRDGIDELHSPTWSAVKGTGIPDRIEPKLRRALADAFAVFDIYNYEVRRFKEYSFTAGPQDPRLNEFGHHIGETKKRLVASAQTVLDMANP